MDEPDFVPLQFTPFPKEEMGKRALEFFEMLNKRRSMRDFSKQPVAKELISIYNLKSGSKVLDIGCGKGYLLYEMKLLIPDLEITGVDSSDYGLENAKDEIRPFIYKHKAEVKLLYEDKEFDLVISLGTFHNLRLLELKIALSEMERVGKKGYLMLESYRNEEELFNLQCWALTAESFFNKDEWIWLYKHFGYTGDYEFIYF